MRRDWSARPFEVANLFNPAYCALIVRHSVEGYSVIKQRGLPYSLAFLALPIVLHAPSSRLLPTSAKTKLHIWLQQNPEIKLGFGERVRGTNDFTREAIFFGLRYGSLILTTGGTIVPVKKRRKALPWSEDSNPRALLRRANLIGKLFAAVDDVSNVFAMLGVRP